MAGRPTKYTEEVVAMLEQAVRLGSTYRLACLYAGISTDSFERWRQEKPAFAARIKKAEGSAAVQWLAKIEAAASEGNWTAAAWKLERRFPDDYGKRERVDVTLTVRQEVERLVAAGVIGADEAEAAIAEAELIVRGRG